MRLFKTRRKFNWRYIFGEILLIFVGINLAIWFNNWNTNKYNSKAKQVAISKIKDEISNNLHQVDTSYTNARLITGALKMLRPLYYQSSSQVLASPEQMQTIQRDFKGFFKIVDSIPYKDGQFIYQGGTMINLELVELSDIAWETTKSLEILNEFGYECLYELESIYNLQARVQTEINKAGDALQQNSNIDPLLRVLNFLIQLESQLEEDYQQMLQNINNCD